MELSAITADTNLDEILKSEEIENENLTTYNSIDKTISGRMQAIESCMNTEGFNSTVEGQVPLKDSAEKVLGSYNNFLESLNSTFSAIDSAAVNREYDELDALRTKINEALPKIDDDIINYQATIDYYDDMEQWELETSGLDTRFYDDAVNAKNACKSKKEEYNNKLLEIEARIAKLDLSSVASTSGNSSDTKTAYFNQIPLFEIGSDGRPTTIPPDFQVDSHHRLDIPGWGCCYEESAGNVSEYHYNPETNMFYWGSAGEDWSNYDYAGDIYALTPEEMLDSEIAGGLIWG